LLLKEGNHRIANSLQLATSILMLRARSAKSAEAREMLDEAANDIHVIGQIHRQLCQSDDKPQIDIGGFLSALCSDIQTSAIGSAGATFSFIADTGGAISFEPERAAQIGLIVTELLTNSAKHAGPKPKCSVSVLLSGMSLQLTVSDDGPGLTDEVQANGGYGVGMQVLKSLVSALKGSLVSAPSVCGTRFLITVPI
jgi:chemotaxis protein methyltransferase CheR